MKRQHTVIVAIVAVVLAPVAVIFLWPGRTSGVEDAAGMERSILLAIPIGTPVSDARRFMVAEGFECRDSTEPGYMYCDRHDGSVVQRRWQVSLVHRHGKLTEVRVDTGLVGP